MIATRANETPLDISVKFVVYGNRKCPFCRMLLSFLEEEYGKDVVLFRDITESKNAEMYRKLLSLLNMERFIPITGLVVNGKVVAVVQGAVTDRDYWESIIKRSSDKVFVRKVTSSKGRIEEYVNVSQDELLKLLM